jgi:hypothetical protein
MLKLFKNNIKNNISIQNTFNLIFVFLKYQKHLENNNIFREIETIEIGIQKNTFRKEYNELVDRIISLN